MNNCNECYIPQHQESKYQPVVTETVTYNYPVPIPYGNQQNETYAARNRLPVIIDGSQPVILRNFETYSHPQTIPTHLATQVYEEKNGPLSAYPNDFVGNMDDRPFYFNDGKVASRGRINDRSSYNPAMDDKTTLSRVVENLKKRIDNQKLTRSFSQSPYASSDPEKANLQQDDMSSNFHEFKKLKEEKKMIDDELLKKNCLIETLRSKYPNDLDLKMNGVVRSADEIKRLKAKNSQLMESNELLLSEKIELKDLLVQRNKEIAAISQMNSKDQDISALQLGIEAIGRVQVNAELKEEIQRLKNSLNCFKDDNVMLNQKCEDLQNKLTDKVKELAELNERLMRKELQITGMNSVIHQKDKEFLNYKAGCQDLLNKAEEELKRIEMNVVSVAEHNDKLKDDIIRKSNDLMLVQGELIKIETEKKDLISRLRVMSDHTKDLQGSMNKMIESNAEKDECLAKLEKQLKDNEIKRQNQFLLELAKTRKIRVATEFAERNCKLMVKQKDATIHELQARIENNKVKLEKLMQVFKSIDGEKKMDDNIYTILNDLPHKREEVGCRRINESTIINKRSEKMGRNSHMSVENTSYYIPCEGDLIDNALANALKQPEICNNIWRSKCQNPNKFFYRLNNGYYLHSDGRKVKLRLNLSNHLQGQLLPDISEWLPFPIFIEKLSRQEH